MALGGLVLAMCGVRVSGCECGKGWGEGGRRWRYGDPSPQQSAPVPAGLWALGPGVTCPLAPGPAVLSRSAPELPPHLGFP